MQAGAYCNIVGTTGVQKCSANSQINLVNGVTCHSCGGTALPYMFPETPLYTIVNRILYSRVCTCIVSIIGHNICFNCWDMFKRNLCYTLLCIKVF